jgi:hypothetical protein
MTHFDRNCSDICLHIKNKTNDNLLLCTVIFSSLEPKKYNCIIIELVWIGLYRALFKYEIYVAVKILNNRY